MISELAGGPSNVQPVSLPRRLRGALAVLVFQIIANGLLGWLVIASLNQDAANGATDSGAGLGYVLGYLSLALAVVLLLCVVFTVRPQAWARPTIIVIESIAMLNGIVNLINGAVAGVVGIALAIAVITTLNNGDVRDWYQHGRVRL